MLVTDGRTDSTTTICLGSSALGIITQSDDYTLHSLTIVISEQKDTQFTHDK